MCYIFFYIFHKKIYPKIFIYFGTKPNLTYYSKNCALWKHFYFPKKKQAHFPTPNKIFKKYTKNFFFLYSKMNAGQEQNKESPILIDECWLSSNIKKFLHPGITAN